MRKDHYMEYIKVDVMLAWCSEMDQQVKPHFIKYSDPIGNYGSQKKPYS